MGYSCFSFSTLPVRSARLDSTFPDPPRSRYMALADFLRPGIGTGLNGCWPVSSTARSRSQTGGMKGMTEW